MREKEREKERENYLNLLKKLAKKRVDAGFTQYDIAQTLGLTESGYFKVEKGKTKLDLERLLIVLNKLEISPEDFFKGIK